jgi:hypothetical protein
MARRAAVRKDPRAGVICVAPRPVWGSQMRGPLLAFPYCGIVSERNMQSEDPSDRYSQDVSCTGRMRRAIQHAAIGTGSPQELDAAAQELVAELRRANEPPEQVLLQIKRILAEAGVRPTHGSDAPAIVVEHHASVYRGVIESSIRHYFQHAGAEPDAI